MSTTTTLYLHHHGDFTKPPNVKYVGGKTEIIKDFDVDMFSFRDLEEFAEKYAYDVSSSLVNFKCNGYSFEKGMRVIYDDNSVRDLIKICMPYGRIELYVDHFDLDLDEVIDYPNEGGDPVEANMGGNDEFSDDTDESDPEYKGSSETEESEDESFVPDEYGSDNEMNAIRENCKKFKQGLVDSMNIPNENVGEESEYDSENEILRSLSSSSEDENAKIGYVGPPNPKKKC
ncbi:hypothetical protein DCAR_0101027 [Daucus carota subsp. sativus]|uniref:PB1-like domain-containing protein n=1 Tax=Daucus carota subsp. sativus TaxID=79200 RepID=A0AAF1AIP3_DAUCS|nr:hypothetical protein DCAR_0101027 [Daucus carota subsp. sativus]